jgi:hypothetical protein
VALKVARGLAIMPLASRSVMFRAMVRGLSPTLVTNWKPRMMLLMRYAERLAGDCRPKEV